MAHNFNDLVFAPNVGLDDGVQAKAFFPNGYGVSVIRSRYSYGGESGLYELAVLKGSEASWEICYDTPLTDDVLGRLSPEEVTQLLDAVESLSADASCAIH